MSKSIRVSSRNKDQFHNISPHSVPHAREAKSYPLFLTGKGGSGTRLLSQVALDLGYDLGLKLNKSLDSLEWVEVCTQQIGRIDSPASSRQSAVLDKNILKLAQSYSKTPWAVKLPTLLFLVPTLDRLFPEAKFIHMIRNPISSSLRRQEKTARFASLGTHILPLAYEYVELKTATKLELKALSSDLCNAYDWNYEVRTLFNYGQTNIKGRYLEIHYEDFCRHPEDNYEKIARFLGVERSQSLKFVYQESETPAHMILDDPTNKKILDIVEDTAYKVGYELIKTKFKTPGAPRVSFQI